MHDTVVANGIDVHDVTAGSGPPVVLLHGFPEFWLRLAPPDPRARREDLTTVELSDCSHLPHEERPDEVNRHLLDFLAGWKG